MLEIIKLKCRFAVLICRLLDCVCCVFSNSPNCTHLSFFFFLSLFFPFHFLISTAFYFAFGCEHFIRNKSLIHSFHLSKMESRFFFSKHTWPHFVSLKSVMMTNYTFNRKACQSAANHLFATINPQLKDHEILSCTQMVRIFLPWACQKRWFFVFNSRQMRLS